MATDQENKEINQNLIISNLDSVGKNLENISSDIKDIKKDIKDLESSFYKIDDLKAWKDKMDDVCSPNSLKESIEKLKQLEEFRVKSVTLFAIAQALIAAGVALIGLLQK